MTLSEAVSLATQIINSGGAGGVVADPSTAAGINTLADHDQQLGQAIIQLAGGVQELTPPVQRIGVPVDFATVSGTNAETVLNSTTIPANSMQVGSVLDLKYSGRLSNASGVGANATLRVKVDGVILHLPLVVSVGAGTETNFTAQFSLAGRTAIAVTQSNPIFFVGTTISLQESQTGSFSFPSADDVPITFSVEWDTAALTIQGILSYRSITLFP